MLRAKSCLQDQVNFNDLCIQSTRKITKNKKKKKKKKPPHHPTPAPTKRIQEWWKHNTQ